MAAPPWMSRLATPTLATQRALAIAAVITQASIAVTGSVVRVTESGLGCPTWPQCTAASLVPVAHPTAGMVHQWIEFSNRLAGIAVGIVGLLVFLATLRTKPRRRRYVLLGLTMPLGFLLQAVLGGITVLMKLQWWTVSMHFLPSPVLMWLAVLLLHAAHEGDEPPRPLIPQSLRALLAAMSVTLGALIIAGTLVTAAGPHAGNIHTPRLALPIANLAQFHADILFIFLGMLAGFGFALRITGGTAALWRRYWILVAAVLAQGTLGMVQYFLGVPDVLVCLHVLGAALVVIAMATLWCATRERGAIPQPTGLPSRKPEPAH